MPQELHVLRCFSCETFQVHIVKKSSNKWQCKMCGEKQSVKQVYGRGSGQDCRVHVQKLNDLRRKKAECAHTVMNANVNEHPELCEQEETSHVAPLCNILPDQDTKKPLLHPGSKWAKFISNNEVSNNEEFETSTPSFNTAVHKTDARESEECVYIPAPKKLKKEFPLFDVNLHRTKWNESPDTENVGCQTQERTSDTLIFDKTVQTNSGQMQVGLDRVLDLKENTVLHIESKTKETNQKSKWSKFIPTENDLNKASFFECAIEQFDKKPVEDSTKIKSDTITDAVHIMDKENKASQSSVSLACDKIKAYITPNNQNKLSLLKSSTNILGYSDNEFDEMLEL